jgi:hypothetical protein
MHLEDTETKKDCAGKCQQQFNRSADRQLVGADRTDATAAENRRQFETCHRCETVAIHRGQEPLNTLAEESA